MPGILKLAVVLDHGGVDAAAAATAAVQHYLLERLACDTHGGSDLQPKNPSRIYYREDVFPTKSVFCVAVGNFTCGIFRNVFIHVICEFDQLSDTY